MSTGSRRELLAVLRPRRADLVGVAGLAAVGVLVGGLWRLLAGVAVDRAAAPEAAAAVDGTLAVLGVALGVVCAVALAVRPGPDPVRRLVVVLAGLVIAGAIAWGTGLALGITALGAVGAAFVAAPVTAFLALVAALADYALRPWTEGPVPPPRSDPADGPGVRPGPPEQSSRP